jgi:hypothetical protein
LRGSNSRSAKNSSLMTVLVDSHEKESVNTQIGVFFRTTISWHRLRQHA